MSLALLMVIGGAIIVGCIIAVGVSDRRRVSTIAAPITGRSVPDHGRPAKRFRRRRE